MSFDFLVWRHPRPEGAAGRCIGAGTDLIVHRRRAKRLARRIQQVARRQRLPHHVVTSPLQRCADVGRWLRRWGWRHEIDPALRDHLENTILAKVPDAHINGDRVHRAPNTTNIRFPGIEGESLVIALDLKGFAVSSGAACSSGAVEPSHVLLALGLSPQDARSAIRFSLGASNTKEQIDALAQAVSESVARLRKLSPAYA